MKLNQHRIFLSLVSLLSLPAMASVNSTRECSLSLLSQTSPVQVFRTEVVQDHVSDLHQEADLEFKSQPAAASDFTFRINREQVFQTMNGFGGALTESCAINLRLLSETQFKGAMQSIFSKQNGAGFDFVRVPMGSSDFANSHLGNYTYDDSPSNEPDPEFKHYDLSRDGKSLKILRQALKINPNLKVMISPWSPPAWMKKPRNLKGGGLDSKHYQDFANYFIRTIHEFMRQGVPVDSLTIQNEPGYANDIYPSMGMSTEEQIRFIRDFLAPALRQEMLKVRIFILDHNYSMFADVNQMLDDPLLKASVHGVAYHCYEGETGDMIHSISRHPDVPTFQTECSGMLDGEDVGGFAWWLSEQALGPTLIGLTGSIGWNLCLDEKGGPTNHGCEGCRGMLTVNRSKAKPQLQFNPEFKALAQVSKVIEPGSKRVGVTAIGGEELVATGFINPDQSESFVVWNSADRELGFSVERSACEVFSYRLKANEAVSFRWRQK